MGMLSIEASLGLSVHNRNYMNRTRPVPMWWPKQRCRGFVIRCSSFHHHNEWFVLFHNIRGEFRSAVLAHVPRGVDHSRRDEQDVTSLQRHYRFTLELILQRTLEDIYDFFPWMPVLAERYSRIEFDTHLHDLASGYAEIMLL